MKIFSLKNKFFFPSCQDLNERGLEKLKLNPWVKKLEIGQKKTSPFY